MGRHKDIRIEDKRVSLFVFLQELPIETVIPRGFENLCAFIPTGDDMVKGSGEMDSGLSGHESVLSGTDSLVNTYLIMPDPIF
jgi:hypothetical protein